MKKRRDQFAEMWVAGQLINAGWNVYFPHRDMGFDLIATFSTGHDLLIRPVQVTGKYPEPGKTNKQRYGVTRRLTALHDDMILAIPIFVGAQDPIPDRVVWLSRKELKQKGGKWSCDPAKFKNGAPVIRESFEAFCDRAGLSRLESQTPG